jgi:hypothetical protein
MERLLCMIATLLALCIRINGFRPWQHYNVQQPYIVRMDMAEQQLEDHEKQRVPRVGAPMPEQRPAWFRVPAPGGSFTRFDSLKVRRARVFCIMYT